MVTVPPFMRLAFDTSMLAMECQFVVAKRLTQMATGQAHHTENSRMVAEKVGAFWEAVGTLSTGGTTSQVVKGYRKRVKANVRRLSR